MAPQWPPLLGGFSSPFFFWTEQIQFNEFWLQVKSLASSSNPQGFSPLKSTAKSMIQLELQQTSVNGPWARGHTIQHDTTDQQSNWVWVNDPTWTSTFNVEVQGVSWPATHPCEMKRAHSQEYCTLWIKWKSNLTLYNSVAPFSCEECIYFQYYFYLFITSHLHF